MAKEKRDKTPNGVKKEKSKKRKLEENGPVEAAPDSSEPPTKVAKNGKVMKKLHLSPIASPLADDKLKKKSLKLVTAATKAKLLKRGVKEVVKAIRKDSKGLVFIAGDIFPVDVIAHLPILCEDRDIPYIYVPSKEELGASGMTKRPSSCMLVLREPTKGELSADELKKFQETYDQVYERVKAVQIRF